MRLGTPANTRAVPSSIAAHKLFSGPHEAPDENLIFPVDYSIINLISTRNFQFTGYKHRDKSQRGQHS